MNKSSLPTTCNIFGRSEANPGEGQGISSSVTRQARASRCATRFGRTNTIDSYTRRDFMKMKKILFLVVVPVMMAVLIQCVSAPQRWPAYERRTEDRLFALQQRIGNGLASGELTPNEAQNLLAKLENIRSEYTVLRERRTTAE